MFITILFLSYVGCIGKEEGDRGYGYGAALPPKVTRDIPIDPSSFSSSLVKAVFWEVVQGGGGGGGGERMGVMEFARKRKEKMGNVKCLVKEKEEDEKRGFFWLGRFGRDRMGDGGFFIYGFHLFLLRHPSSRPFIMEDHHPHQEKKEGERYPISIKGGPPPYSDDIWKEEKSYALFSSFFFLLPSV